MEITQLDPKVERHLVEVQKILNRDPVVRRKLWVTFIISVMIAIGVILFTKSFYISSENSDKDEISYLILSNTVVSWISISYVTGMAFGMFVIFLPFALGRQMTCQVIKHANKLHNKLKTVNLEKTVNSFSKKEVKNNKFLMCSYYALILYSWMIISLFGYLVGFNMVILLSGTFDCFVQNTMYSTTMLQTIKWLSIGTGFMCGIAFTMSFILGITSMVSLIAAKSYHEELLIKLRNLEREICESPSA